MTRPGSVHSIELGRLAGRVVRRGVAKAVRRAANPDLDVTPMSSPSLRLVASNPAVRQRKPAIRHHVSVPGDQSRPAQSGASIARMATAAAAVPLVWIAHAILHSLRVL
jgi:hypothetical protein